ncbi:MAG: mannosyl-3-phosphoglycerate phosphatase family protein [Cellvibrionaceae bacterium]|jgi:mannosyl-3-phosphoglycerate phosphatase family protein
METNEQVNWIIVTDLDGTLLDHNTYSFEAAIATLEKLKQHNMPVVINSSKTASEIEELRSTLNNPHPFIAENGSGIMIPKQYFTKQPDASERFGAYWEVILGKPRIQIIDALKKLPPQFKQYYRSYHQSAVDDIIRITGLSREQAECSMDRRYTEPLQWLGDSYQRKQFFWHLHKQHIHFTEGGRFIHLMGHTNKGSATSWLAKHYEEEYKKKVKVVALGDGNNDIDMLKTADVAVVVRSPVNKPPELDHRCKIVTEKTGPEGWAEAIEKLFFGHAKSQI